MQNYRQRGDVIDWTNSGSSAVAAGALVLVGDRAGVPVTDIPKDATGALMVRGVFEFDYAGDQAEQGQVIYLDDGGALTDAADDGAPEGAVEYTPIGYAAAPSADGKVKVAING